MWCPQHRALGRHGGGVRGSQRKVRGRGGCPSGLPGWWSARVGRPQGRVSSPRSPALPAREWIVMLAFSCSPAVAALSHHLVAPGSRRRRCSNIHQPDDIRYERRPPRFGTRPSPSASGLRWVGGVRSPSVSPVADPLWVWGLVSPSRKWACVHACHDP